jgi:hypothetical protein
MKGRVINRSFDELCELVSCGSIPEGKVRGILSFDGAIYVVTGARYGRGGEFYAVPCIPLKSRRSDHPKPRTYARKTAVLNRLCEIGLHKTMADRIRENFYSGMVFRYKGQEWLLLPGSITLIPATASQPEQLDLIP